MSSRLAMTVILILTLTLSKLYIGIRPVGSALLFPSFFFSRAPRPFPCLVGPVGGRTGRTLSDRVGLVFYTVSEFLAVAVTIHNM